jgi:hypothetical protein
MDTKAVKRYMQAEVYEEQGYRGPYIDPTCLDVNTTALAEAAAYEFELYGPAPDFEIPEEVFELAMVVGEHVEAEIKPD